MFVWHLFFYHNSRVTSVAPHQNNITAISFNDLRERGREEREREGLPKKSPITIILRCANEGSRHKLKNHSRMWCVNTDGPLVFNEKTNLARSVLIVNTHGRSGLKMQQLWLLLTNTTTVAKFACAGSKVERKTEISSKQNVSIGILPIAFVVGVKTEWISI